MPTFQPELIRAQLLAASPSACVARELWSTTSGTYSAYRECVQARKQLAAAWRQEAGGQGGAAGARGPRLAGSSLRTSAALPAVPPTVKYSFEGVKHVLAETTAPVTVMAFAALRNDLLAFGCLDGELWVVGLPPAAAGQSPPSCTKTRKMHGQAVQAIDWAYDNSQLLSVGYDGSLCVWDASDTEVPCIRSVSMPTTAFLCGRFHKVNFSLALVGTSAGSLDVYNCNTGLMHSRYKLPPQRAGVQVTALDSSNHHVFVGDSSGMLHLYAFEMHERQLTRLQPASRLRLLAPGKPPAAVTWLHYVPFCAATDSPVLVTATQDGALCIVKANEARHSAELYLRRFVTPPSPAAAAAAATTCAPGPGGTTAGVVSGAAGTATLARLCPAICPLSVMHDVPLITFGSDDTSVYIVDVTYKSFGSTAAARGGGGAGGGAASGGGGGAAAAADRPLTVTVLKAHRALVTAVAWSYDEALLASADAGGIVVLWQRSRLF